MKYTKKLEKHISNKLGGAENCKVVFDTLVRLEGGYFDDFDFQLDEFLDSIKYAKICEHTAISGGTSWNFQKIISWEFNRNKTITFLESAK